MQKYGFKEGQGLGKHEQGLSTALSVEKTSKRGGKIIIGDAAEKREGAVFSMLIFSYHHEYTVQGPHVISCFIFCLLFGFCSTLICAILPSFGWFTATLCTSTCFILCASVCVRGGAAGSSLSGVAETSGGGSAGWPPLHFSLAHIQKVCVCMCFFCFFLCALICGHSQLAEWT